MHETRGEGSTPTTDARRGRSRPLRAFPGVLALLALAVLGAGSVIMAQIFLTSDDPLGAPNWTRADAAGLGVTVFWPIVMLLVWLFLTGALLLERRPRSILLAFGVCALACLWFYVVTLLTGLLYGSLLPTAGVFLVMLAVDAPVVYVGWRLISHRRPHGHLARP